ncbi:MAG: aminotransferase class V-fold PLP-dependent enzyme [Ascidiaceihabitans sp.]|uniref:aminotransferase class V-fold PLP-dependent enzyme n=1 Tax=Rhodobacterales TaxID=204455 RepID=UPI00329834EC
MSLTALENFASSLTTADTIGDLRHGLIGDGIDIPGLNGTNKLVYADYVASGRALSQIEEFVLHNVLPYYSNSHTEASYCGAHISALRAEARGVIAKACGAGSEHAVIFSGSGATSGLNRIVHLFGVRQAAKQGRNPLVLVGPYEHHSNILPWRESGAEVVEITECATGGPDMAALKSQLIAASGRMVIGAFGAASNVTGIQTDTKAVTRLLKQYGALAVWDFAGAGPYVPINLFADKDYAMDAVVISPHKFLGGPGASGVLIVKTTAVITATPTLTGGGTVKFVSPWGHDYSDSVIAREEAGTPNIVGDIRAACAFIVKAAIGEEVMADRQSQFFTAAKERWGANPFIEILGNPTATDRLPIFSMRIKATKGEGYVHQQLFTRMLSDVYGIQARGGCACAGPYAHRLMGIDAAQSAHIRSAIAKGEEMEKPGWTRLNFSVLLSDEKARFIIDSVDELARTSERYTQRYLCDQSTARFQLEAA